MPRKEKEAPHKRIRHGVSTGEQDAKATLERKTEYTVLSSNGPFTKVVKDGVVSVLPTAEVYSTEGTEQEEGLQVGDATVVREVEASVRDRAEEKFGRRKLFRTRVAKEMSEAKGDRQVGEAETLVEEGNPGTDAGTGTDVPADIGSELDAAVLQPVAPEVTEIADDNEETQTEGDEAVGEFDAHNPRATTLANLGAALDKLTDDEVKKARRRDDRAGAVEIYERRLAR